MIKRTADAIYNDIVAGLSGYTSNPSISLEQLEDEVIEERLAIIKEYSLKNVISKRDLEMSINCIPIDCKSLDRCPCGRDLSKPVMHFQIPQLAVDIPGGAISYIGTIDRGTRFRYYTSPMFKYHSKMRRGASKPYVYIDPVPNSKNMVDGWIFNAPLLETISVVGVFKDPRQVSEFDCCANDSLENYSFISSEIKRRLIEKKIRYYRQLWNPPHPNNQIPK